MYLGFYPSYSEYRKPLLLEPEKATKVITNICTLLHNFMRKHDSCETYNPPGTFDKEQYGEIIPGFWRVEEMARGTLLKLKKVLRKPSLLAKNVQTSFLEYFVSDPGKVFWQHK